MADTIEILAGRELGSNDRRQVARGLVRRFDADPAALRSALGEFGATRERLMSLTGLEAAEARSTVVYDMWKRPEALGDDDLQAVFDRAVAVWAHDDTDRLALTEVDIEGWIFYSSLCREVQEAGPLRLSVADRVTVYRDLVVRYEGTDRDGRVALAAFGAFWPQVQEAWAMASWEQQRAWIDRAPLPPPMVATSKGYFGAIVEGDVAAHARALHAVLGPFHLAVFR